MQRSRSFLGLGILCLTLLLAGLWAPTRESRPHTGAASGAAGVKAFVDPLTGELTTDPTAAQRQRLSARSTRAIERSVEGLRPFSLRRGGRGVYLQGRFKTSLRLVKAPVVSRATVSATMGLDTDFLAGADPQGRLRLFAPDPVDPGSSISHWDSLAVPDLLMEPAIGGGVSIGDIDLTLEQMRDIGWSPGSSNIVVVFDDAPGEGFFAPEPLGGNRRNAFTHVADIWSDLLQSSVPIRVSASFESLECGDGGSVLAQAGPQFIYESFAGAHVSSVWYPGPLAESLSGENLSVEDDVNPDAADIEVTFNSEIDESCAGSGTSFHYGLSGTAPSNQLSFVNVALHEMGHGLGFVSFVNESTGANPFGLPDIYSVFALDTTSGLHWDEMNNAERRASAINTGRLVWDGANVHAAAPSFLSGSPILFVAAPSSVDGGYEVATAGFGPALDNAGTSGNLVQIDDGAAPNRDGCTPIVNAGAVSGNLALIDRGDCTFVVKVKNAQNAGAAGVVIVNHEAGPPVPMGGTDATIVIPAVMIRQDDGALLTAAIENDAPPPPPSTPKPTPTPKPTATPTPPAVPGAPSGLVAEALSQSAVLLKWTDGATNETELRIESRSGAGAFAEVATVAANTTYATVEDLAPATEHTFRVRARNGSVFSSYSNTAAATTQASASACVPGPNTACLLDGQFRITGAMKNFAAPPATFPIEVMDFALGRAESNEAVFWESFEAGNFEVATKMNDACGLPQGHPLRAYWAFFGGLTNQRTDMVIRDTVTGETYNWTNPANQLPTTIADTAAFPCESPGAPGSCVRDGDTACLIGGRFEVTGEMRNAANDVFATRVMSTDLLAPGSARTPVSRTRAETDQAAFFQSFEAGNFEVGVKMVDACALAPGNPLRFFWIFYGGLTNADTEVHAVHVPTGRASVWRNPAGSLPTSEARTNAFPCS